MSGRYLLDTNVAVAVLNGALGLAAHRAAGAEVYLNAIIVGELCFGAEKSGRVEANLAAIELHGGRADLRFGKLPGGVPDERIALVALVHGVSSLGVRGC